MEKNVDQHIGYQLKRVQHQLRLHMDETLRELGLTAPQYAALTEIEEAPGLSGNRLARRSFVTAQTMNLILTNLEHAGLIVRRPHPEFGRVLQAFLTPKGEQLVQEGHRRVYAIEERMLANFTAAQRLQLADALRQCAQSLEAGAALEKSEDASS